MSGWANVYWASVRGLLSGQVTVRSGYCLVGFCLSGKSPSGYCLSGMCPRGSVRRASARSSYCPDTIQKWSFSGHLVVKSNLAGHAASVSCCRLCPRKPLFMNLEF